MNRELEIRKRPSGSGLSSNQIGQREQKRAKGDFMEDQNIFITASQGEEGTMLLKKSRKRFTRSLEYELIASLAVQQYANKEAVDFKKLLSIPLKDRIPALVEEYGLKRMHRLVKTMLQEFCYSIALPKTRKLTDTRISVCACDLLLVSEEDQLSIEDLIVFFEQAKNGVYGKFKGVLTHFSIMEKLEQFRQQRYESYVKLREEKETEKKSWGPVERVASEPTVIKHLFDEVGGKIVPFKKIS
ncbi:MAG: DUF6633 family protein [Flavisolibacter sp.]